MLLSVLTSRENLNKSMSIILIVFQVAMVKVQLEEAEHRMDFKVGEGVELIKVNSILFIQKVFYSPNVFSSVIFCV